MGNASLTEHSRDIFSEPIEGRLKLYNKQYASVLKSLRNKEMITVAFQVIHRSIWKYDRIFQLMRKDTYFKPVVFVCPYLRENEKKMMEELNATYEEMLSKGYEVIKTYDEETKSWIDVKEILKPDIVFYSVPFDYTRDEYRIHHFTDSLSCYVPYFFTTNGKEGRNYDGPFHNLVWRNFYETEIHKEYAELYARNHARNVVVTGYPPLDEFMSPDLQNDWDPWPLLNHKRIIWAPHHTIDGQGQGLNYSTFIRYHAFFQEIAIEYSDLIQIAFKPHPMLKEKLYKDKKWGKIRTDEYYTFWEDLENGMLEQSGYTRLFLTSDALIHDCSSFMVEYLCTLKPTLYLMHDENVGERLHEFGKMALMQHYLAWGAKDIKNFIEEQILQQHDPRLLGRKQFIKQHLTSENGKTSSLQIIEYIKQEIQGGRSDG